MMFRDFGGTKHTAMMEVGLELEVKPCQFEVSFVMRDMPATFTCCHPWIHTVGPVLSSLH